MKLRNTDGYREISIEETLRLLETSVDGLTEPEAKNRVGIFGYNEVVEKKSNPLLEFLRRYWGPMPWLLESAIVLSYVLGHNFEAMIIFVLLTTNAIIGYMHSRTSQRALEVLKKRLAIKAKVLRDGNWVIGDARVIVPGDIITVGLGDVVPADSKILSGALSVDQSALTGESLPVELHQSDIIYSGSTVRRGGARSVVVNAGTNTYFGRTAELVKIAKPKSHQEEIMMEVVKYMMYVGLAALALVSTYAVLLNIPILSILTFLVVFLMGAVPIALPAVLTIVQAVGAMELVRKGVLVTRLDSIEDASSIDVICLDKTGTITQNKLTVMDTTPSPGYSGQDVIRVASLASEEERKDPIDLAVLEYAKASGVDPDAYRKISFTPFDPSTKRSEAVVEAEGKRLRAVKGAPQIIIPMCGETGAETKQKAYNMVDELSQKGYRTIAVAESLENGLDNLQLTGLISLADPPRVDSRNMIEEARDLGVKPIMLTGDNIAIAREVARQVSIGDKIIRMGVLKGLTDEEQARLVEENDGLAEIYPEDKYRIVKLLQSRGHMVGMTGDGVNDAPALKQAEMGIAVSNSTDVAKASASVILTGPGMGVIVDAIRTSRQTYQRMLTWVINKVTKVIQFIGLLTLGFFWLREQVISLLGMSLLILANDFVTMSLATDNVEYTSNPNKWNVKNVTSASLVIGTLLVLEGAIGILVGIDYFHLGSEKMQTLVALLLIFTSQFRVYIVRERRRFWSSRPGRELLISTTAALAAFILLGIYGIIIAPLEPYQVLFIVGFSALFTFGIDLPKYYAFRKFGL